MPSRRDFVAHAAALAAISLAGPARAGATAHDFTFQALEGGEIRMADFAGRAVLVVNTASFCAFTPQYEGLQRLADETGPGLVVLGVPSDDFHQESDSAAEVKEFCEVNFGITFPMTDITHVKGDRAHPFYAWAASQGVRPRWNFHKILIGPDGTIRADFSSATDPAAPVLRSTVNAALKA